MGVMRRMGGMGRKGLAWRRRGAEGREDLAAKGRKRHREKRRRKEGFGRDGRDEKTKEWE